MWFYWNKFFTTTLIRLAKKMRRHKQVLNWPRNSKRKRTSKNWKRKDPEFSVRRIKRQKNQTPNGTKVTTKIRATRIKKKNSTERWRYCTVHYVKIITKLLIPCHWLIYTFVTDCGRNRRRWGWSENVGWKSAKWRVGCCNQPLHFEHRFSRK